MLSLKRILNEMEQKRPEAEMSLEMVNPSTYNARLGLKRAALEELDYLKIQYHQQLLASAAFIVVTGTNKDTFSELAGGEKFECFLADPDDFYKDLVSRMNSALFGRESVKYLFNIASNILEIKARELDIKSYPMLMFNDKYNSAVNSAEDFVPLVKSAVNDQVGSEIVGINAVKSILNKAIERKHAVSVTPIVLSTSDEKFALDLLTNLKRLTSKVFLVVAGKASKPLSQTLGAFLVKTVNEETVGQALDAIRNKV